MPEPPLSPHAIRNAQVWDDRHSAWFGSRAAQQWEAAPHWGIWAVPEAELHVLSGVQDKDLIDLGCGTASIGARTRRADGGVNFQLPTGAMIGVLRAAGLVVDELVEIIVPATSQSDWDYCTPEWASKWPSAELPRATKTG